MNPLFFGDSSEPLFGVYHPPARSSRPVCALLCPPLHEEYVYSHRALRALANRLAAAGVATLRFDYFGSGDSSGAREDMSILTCEQNVATAAAELMDISGSPRVVLTGLRMGATIAALAADRIPRVENVVLWDPVVNGQDYLEDLVSRFDTPPAWREPLDDDFSEGLEGYPMPAEFVAALRTLSLTSVSEYPGDRICLVRCEQSPAYDQLLAHFETEHIEFADVLVAAQRVWEAKSQSSNELISRELIDRVVTWICE